MRHALFAGDDYYPIGGMYDFRGMGAIDELKSKYAYPDIEWAHIVDVDTMRIVCHFDGEEQAWVDGEDPWRAEEQWEGYRR